MLVELVHEELRMPEEVSLVADCLNKVPYTHSPQIAAAWDQMSASKLASKMFH